MPAPKQPRLAEDAELRDRLIGFIAKRDRVAVDRAKEIFTAMNDQEVVALELYERDRSPPLFTADYDPFARP